MTRQFADSFNQIVGPPLNLNKSPILQTMPDYNVGIAC